MSESTAHKHRRLMEEAARYIGEHLEQPLRLEHLALRAGLSRFYFQRLFREHLGESPTQYAKRLRLERSAFLLRQPGSSVTETAFDSAYEAHESFTRAFRARFGISPRDFRKMAQVRRRESTRPFEVVMLKSRRLACVRFIGPYSDAMDAFDHLRHWAEPLGLMNDQRMLGIYRDDQEITDADKTRSDAALVVPVELELGPGMQERIFPAGFYAYVHHRGPHSVRDTYEEYFRDWFPRFGWRPDHRPMLVEYDDAVEPWEAAMFVAVTR